MLNLTLYKIILGGLIALLIVTTIWAIRGTGKRAPLRRPVKGPSPQGDPISYLQELYAKGEINKEEYETRKKHLTV